MKKELALSALTAIIAVSTDVKEQQQPQEAIVNEAHLDHYVTGCQCKSPQINRPRCSNDDSVV